MLAWEHAYHTNGQLISGVLMFCAHQILRVYGGDREETHCYTATNSSHLHVVATSYENQTHSHRVKLKRSSLNVGHPASVLASCGEASRISYS